MFGDIGDIGDIVDPASGFKDTLKSVNKKIKSNKGDFGNVFFGSIIATFTKAFCVLDNINLGNYV